MRIHPISHSPPQEEVIEFLAGDGRKLNLIHVQGACPPTKGPVLLVHGAGVRANIFRPPMRQTLVGTLVADGYDVWLENWRASIDLEANPWTLDQAALYDHPRAVQEVVRRTGQDEIKAIVHCQGSTSFMWSAIAGLIPEVKLILSNAVSLHPVMPPAAAWKLRFSIPWASRLLTYLDPQWGLGGTKQLIARLLTLFVRATHHECDNLVCRMASFIYGVGFPTLWHHEQISAETHDWLTHEFAKVPLSFFRQILSSVVAGRLVPVEGYPQLPEDLLDRPPQTDARVVFLAGARNSCFLAEGQRRSYEALSRFRPGYHSLHVFPDYGHLDVFLGQNAWRDVFPTIRSELNRSH
jgi:pimeloyl-ACP methyl ester carboxylesterase